jgi:hypothetical protein
LSRNAVWFASAPSGPALVPATKTFPTVSVAIELASENPSDASERYVAHTSADPAGFSFPATARRLSDMPAMTGKLDW